MPRSKGPVSHRMNQQPGAKRTVKAHPFFPRQPGLQPKRTGHQTQRIGQLARYQQIKNQIAEVIQNHPDQTAMSLKRMGFPYTTANKILNELEAEGRYQPSVDRAKKVGERKPEGIKRREWLSQQIKAGKTVKDILAHPETPYQNERQIHKDIANLRLRQKKADVTIHDPFEKQVRQIEELIRERPGIRNEELMRLVGIKSKTALLDRLRRCDQQLLKKRVLPTGIFSREQMQQQNALIGKLAREGKKTSEIIAALQKQLGVTLTVEQINGRPSTRKAAVGKRVLGRSKFSREVIERQNQHIRQLVTLGIGPAEMTRDPILAGLTPKDIKDRLYRLRRKNRE